MTEQTSSLDRFKKSNTKTILYRFLALLTFLYVAGELLVFHLHLESIPGELGILWDMLLFVYIMVKETFKWTEIRAKSEHYGEVFAVFIILVCLWMIGFMTYDSWIGAEDPRKLPDGYLYSVLWAVAMIGASLISSALFHAKKHNGAQKELPLKDE